MWSRLGLGLGCTKEQKTNGSQCKALANISIPTCVCVCAYVCVRVRQSSWMSLLVCLPLLGSPSKCLQSHRLFPCAVSLPSNQKVFWVFLKVLHTESNSCQKGQTLRTQSRDSQGKCLTRLAAKVKKKRVGLGRFFPRNQEIRVIQLSEEKKNHKRFIFFVWMMFSFFTNSGHFSTVCNRDDVSFACCGKLQR